MRRLFPGEGILLALAGSALGIPGAIAYAALLMTALGSWWVDAVGTEALTLHVSMFSLLAGAVGGIAAAVACIWWTLRSLGAISERSLLAGRIETNRRYGLPPPDEHDADSCRISLADAPATSAPPPCSR